MRKVLFIIFTLVAVVAFGRTYSVDEIPNVQVQDRTKYFSNPDGIVSPQVQSAIDSILVDANRRSTVEIAAVIVDDIDSSDIDDFATKLFREWGIGKKDNNNGILLLAAKDKRKFVIRTGYGAEGVMPDILAGHILYDIMAPRFKEGDYGAGMLEAAKEINRLVTDPEAAAELTSQLKNKQHGNDSGDEFFNIYLWMCGVVAIASLVLLLFLLNRCKNMPDYDKYDYTSKYVAPLWIVTVFFIFIPIVAAILLTLLRYRWRNKPHTCPRCQHKMKKLDEETDNKFLRPAEDLEERIGSVDYDVWHCDNCGEVEVLSYVNKASSYTECPVCHARALKLAGSYVIQNPTPRSEGIEEKQYICLNCRNQQRRRFKLPKTEDTSAAALAGMMIGSSMGRHGGGFGGFGGGSIGGGFGGGLTGGGGASGGW